MTFYEFLDKNKLIKGLIIIALIMVILHFGYYMYNGYTLNSEYVSLKPPVEKAKSTDTIPKKDSVKKVIKPKVITPKIKYIYIPQKANDKDTAKAVEQKTSSPVNVTSYNQTGGITAKEVNFGKVDIIRKLTIDQKESVLKFIANKNEKITIYFLVNDNEGYQYAKQFYDFLLDNNYTNVNNYITPIMTTKPLFGQYVYRNKKGEVEIKIGTAQE